MIKNTYFKNNWSHLKLFHHGAFVAKCDLKEKKKVCQKKLSYSRTIKQP